MDHTRINSLREFMRTIPGGLARIVTVPLPVPVPEWNTETGIEPTIFQLFKLAGGRPPLLLERAGGRVRREDRLEGIGRMTATVAG